MNVPEQHAQEHNRRNKQDKKQQDKKQQKKLFEFVYNFVNVTMPSKWNAHIELHNNSVNMKYYSESVTKAKTILLKVIDDKLDIDKTEFLKLTFINLPKQPWYKGRNPRIKTQMQLYTIDETAEHTRDRCLDLVFGKYFQYRREHVELVKYIFKEALQPFIDNAENKTDQQIVDNAEYKIDQQTVEELKKVLLWSEQEDGLVNDIVLCELLLYAVIMSDVSQKDKPDVDAKETDNAQKRSVFSKLWQWGKRPDSNTRQSGGKKSRAKKRRNRKTSRRNK